jgi:hypothetical protein
MLRLTAAVLALASLCAVRANVTPVIIPVATNGIEGYTTVRLALRLDFKGSVYAIAGTSTSEMIIPPAYQVGAPWGTDVGGADPAFFTYFPPLQYDSWLTASETGGDNPNAGTTGVVDSVIYIGMNFTEWTDEQGMNVDDGAVFWMTPTASPIAEAGQDIVVAQLTVRTGTQFLASMVAHGKRWCPEWEAHPENCDNWSHDGIVFVQAEDPNVADTRSIQTCVAGQADTDGDPMTSCVACSAGKYSSEESAECTPCEAGTYDSDGDAATACKPCPAGFSSTAVATICFANHCSTGLIIEHSTTICNGYRTGETCVVTCSAGYELSGEHVCAADGALQGATCVAASCTAGLTVDFGAASPACVGVTGETCDPQCTPDYKPSGRCARLPGGRRVLWW